MSITIVMTMSIEQAEPKVEIRGWDSYISMLESSLSPTDLILWLASVSPIRGNVRLQKETFLLWKEHYNIVLDPGFCAAKCGPHSQLVQDSIKVLKVRGLIDEMPGRMYQITKKGTKYLAKKLQNMRITSEQITDKKIRWDEWDTQGIMRYVCRMYPEYATKSGMAHLKW